MAKVTIDEAAVWATLEADLPRLAGLIDQAPAARAKKHAMEERQAADEATRKAAEERLANRLTLKEICAKDHDRNLAPDELEVLANEVRAALDDYAARIERNATTGVTPFWWTGDG